MWYGGTEQTVQAGEFRPLAGRLQEAVDLLRQELDRPTTVILKHQAEPARPSEPGDCRRQDGKRAPFGELGQLAVEGGLDPLDARLGCPAFLPGLKADEKRRGIRGRGSSEEIETSERIVTSYPGGAAENLPDLAGHGIRTLEGGGIGQLQKDDEIAIVFVRQEPTRQGPTQYTRRDCEHDKEEQTACRLPYEDPGEADIAVGGALEPAIEASKEPA